MAVTKIRKFSSWTLLIISVISIAVLGIFFFGGVENPGEEQKIPVYTNLLLDWTSILFIVSVVSMLFFGVMQFLSTFRSNAKSAITSLIVVVCFFAMLFITYSFGDDTPLKVLNADSQDYNTPGWLKITDMWILSTGILLISIIGCVIWGSLKKLAGK